MRRTDWIWIRRGCSWGLSLGVLQVIQTLFIFPGSKTSALRLLTASLLLGVVAGVGAAVFVRLGDDHS